MGQDDVQLLKACLDGKPGAWEAFVERFTPPLAGVCSRILQRSGRPSGSQEVADMLQVVFLHLLKRGMRALRAYRGRGPLEAYLASVAVCRVLDDRTLPPGAPPPSLPPDERQDPAPAPPEALEARETLHRLGLEVKQLPPKARLALTFQAEGHSLEEIGKTLGLSYEATTKLLSRARLKLRERLEEL